MDGHPTIYFSKSFVVTSKLFYNDLILLLNSLRNVTMVVILPAKWQGGVAEHRY
jgi:hypothetical protein